MIKVICIKNHNDFIDEAQGIKKGVIYFTYNDYFIVNNIIHVYTSPKNETYLGTFLKYHFLTLDEWREQKINKILEWEN